MKHSSLRSFGLILASLVFVSGCGMRIVPNGGRGMVITGPNAPGGPSIVRVDHDAAKPLKKGDTVHFSVETDRSLPATYAGYGIKVLIDGRTEIQLYNDGTHGDKVAGDNLFERDYAIGDADHKVENANVVASSTSREQFLAEKPITIEP